MFYLSQVTYTASGNISPARFVAQVSGSDWSVYQANAAARPVGISQYSSVYAPGTDTDLGYAGVDGKILHVAQPGMDALLEIGGVVSAGDFLIPDSVGRGVQASLTSTSHQDIGAYALQSSSTTGAKIRVKVTQLPARQA